MPNAAVPSFSLAGKVIIQFGGSGLLAPAITKAVAGAGATLVIASRNPSGPTVDTDRPQVKSACVHGEEVDLLNEASIRDLCKRITTNLGRLDGMVYNVVSRPMTGLHDSLSRWNDSMRLNATGFFAAVRTCGDAMAAHNSGSIVNIASMQGMIGPNPWLYKSSTMVAPPDYFFHKGGMINLTRYFASHFGTYGVRVNAISPGGIYNPDRPPPVDFLKRYAKLTMLGRMADAAEIAGAVVFLLSDASTYITGINLPVDGGYTAK